MWWPSCPGSRPSRPSADSSDAAPETQRRSRRPHHAHVGQGHHRDGAAGHREDLGEPGRGPLSDPHRHGAFRAHAGRHHTRGVHAPLCAGQDAPHPGQAVGPRDRNADLPGELLPQQGGAREGVLPDVGVALRRPCAQHHGGSGVAARRRPQDRQPGADPGLSQPGEHLRGHARAPHLEPHGLGADGAPGRDRAGAVHGHGPALVALHQPVSGHLGPERLSSRVPAVR